MTASAADAQHRPGAFRAACDNGPCSTLLRLSSDGVAEPSTIGIPELAGTQHGHIAAVIAGPVLLLERAIVFFVDHDQRRLCQRQNTAERVPTITRARPLAAACQQARRSPSLRPEW
jgi:hypothetical protein